MFGGAAHPRRRADGVLHDPAGAHDVLRRAALGAAADPPTGTTTTRTRRPPTMTVPMVVLAVGSVFAGFLLYVGGPARRSSPRRSASSTSPKARSSAHSRGAVPRGRHLRARRAGRLADGRAPPRTGRPSPRRVSLPVRAARRDLYANAINEALIARPGIWLTRALVYFDNRGVDGLVNGIRGGARRQLGAAAPVADRLRPLVRAEHARRLGPRHRCAPRGGVRVNLLLPRPAGVPAARRPGDVPAAGQPGRGQEGRDRHGAAADRARGRHVVRLLGTGRRGGHPLPARVRASTGSRRSAPSSRSGSTASRSS